MIDGNFGNVSAGVLFSKVGVSTKTMETKIDAREGGNRGNYYMRCTSAGHHMTIEGNRCRQPIFMLHWSRFTVWTKDRTLTEKWNQRYLGSSGFSIEFCTAVAVVFTGITLICRGKGCVYYARGKTTSAKGLGSIYKFNMAAIFSTLQRRYEAIAKSFLLCPARMVRI